MWPPTFISGMISLKKTVYDIGLYPTNSWSNRVHPVVRLIRHTGLLKLRTSQLVVSVKPGLRGNIGVSRVLTKLVIMTILVATSTRNIVGIVSGLVWG